MDKSTNRHYLTAISIVGGIITLVEPNGTIGYYRQRGMGKIKEQEMEKLIKRGLVNSNWSKVKELPKNYTIRFEDEMLQGKAHATFKIK